MLYWPAFDAGPLGKFRSRVVRTALNNVPARETRSSAEPARCRLGGNIRVRHWCPFGKFNSCESLLGARWRPQCPGRQKSEPGHGVSLLGLALGFALSLRIRLPEAR
jgi:hypothetical protein